VKPVSRSIGSRVDGLTPGGFQKLRVNCIRLAPGPHRESVGRLVVAATRRRAPADAANSAARRRRRQLALGQRGVEHLQVFVEAGRSRYKSNLKKQILKPGNHLIGSRVETRRFQAMGQLYSTCTAPPRDVLVDEIVALLCPGVARDKLRFERANFETSFALHRLKG
jgi:hypothetical protein